MEEAIKYCSIDCISLFEILVKFNTLIFTHFKQNIHEALTLPSLDMRIFKSLFMPENKLYKILGQVERDIREAYTGGAVDVYIPQNLKLHMVEEPDQELVCLDVYSLYPSVMKSMPILTGKPIAFEGNIFEVMEKPFGFFFCKIKSPDKLEHPILQRRIKGVRTIAGLGSFPTIYQILGNVESDIRQAYTGGAVVLRGVSTP